jgi:polyferredoxin
VLFFQLTVLHKNLRGENYNQDKKYETFLHGEVFYLFYKYLYFLLYEAGWINIPKIYYPQIVETFFELFVIRATITGSI